MSNYKVQKVARTLRLADNEFKPAKYWVYEVKQAGKVVKKFASLKTARMWVNKQNPSPKYQLKAVYRDGRPANSIPNVKNLI
jgi:hypothetical protein